MQHNKKAVLIGLVCLIILLAKVFGVIISHTPENLHFLGWLFFCFFSFALFVAAEEAVSYPGISRSQMAEIISLKGVGFIIGMSIALPAIFVIAAVLATLLVAAMTIVIIRYSLNT